MAEIWQEFSQGAEAFEQYAKATVSARIKTWRTKQALSTIATMSDVTKHAWELGLLSSITQLRKMLDKTDPLEELLFRRTGWKFDLADLFKSLTGFSSWTSEKNDKTEWDVDENGETYFFIPPITYFYFEDGLLAKWGLVESLKVYIGEVRGDEEADFDDNKLTPQNRARVLASYAEACRFLSDITKTEQSKNIPATISANQFAEECVERLGVEPKTPKNWMSCKTFPKPIKPGRNRVFIRQEVETWLKINKQSKD